MNSMLPGKSAWDSKHMKITLHDDVTNEQLDSIHRHIAKRDYPIVTEEDGSGDPVYLISALSRRQFIGSRERPS